VRTNKKSPALRRGWHLFGRVHPHRAAGGIFPAGAFHLRRGWDFLISEDDVCDVVAGPTIRLTVKKNVFMIWGTDA
jgi:hypothetical protein